MKKLLSFISILFAFSVIAQPTVVQTVKIPSQAGHAGEYLKTDGTKLLFGTPAGGGGGSTTTITASTNINVTGTAPNYTLSSPSQTLSISGNTISLSASGGSVAIPTQTTGLASLSGTETLTNKRITARTSTTTTTATITVNSDSYDLVAVTSLSTATTFTAPTGTPTEGQGLIYRIKDNGTAMALTFNSAFRFSSDIPAPTTTIVSKWMYLFFVYNLTDGKWDCLTVSTNY